MIQCSDHSCKQFVVIISSGDLEEFKDALSALLEKRETSSHNLYSKRPTPPGN